MDDLLRRRYPVNRLDTLGKTPLHHAVAPGHWRVIERLLNAGANVNAHDERWVGNTPLSDNTRTCPFEMTRRLIEAGADPTVPGWMGMNALHRAADRTDADAKKLQQLLRDAAGRRRG